MTTPKEPHMTEKLEELAARVEAATGPDRELDAAYVWPKGHPMRDWHLRRAAALRARSAEEK